MCKSCRTLSFLRSISLISRRSKYSHLKQAPANPMPIRISPNKMSSKFIVVHNSKGTQLHSSLLRVYEPSVACFSR
jgi:hypothetical protein